MNYFENWLNDLKERRSMPLTTPVRVEGVRDQVLGPRADYAKIDILCGPAERFEVKFDLPNDLPNLEEAQEYGYFDWAVLGILDVLMTELKYPLRDVRITFKGIEVHPVHANQMAFRLAGRIAAKNILKAI